MGWAVVGPCVGTMAGCGAGVIVFVLEPVEASPDIQRPVRAIAVDHIHEGRFPASEQLAVGIFEGDFLLDIWAAVAAIDAKRFDVCVAHGCSFFLQFLTRVGKPIVRGVILAPTSSV